MGGFEGGDEAGYWEVTPPACSSKKEQYDKLLHTSYKDGIYTIRSYGRITLYLKITGIVNDNCTLLSRVMRINNLYDTLHFVPQNGSGFCIEGCEDIPLEDNSIFKVYKALLNATQDSDIEEFFQAHAVRIDKRIPISSGFDAAASNAASFLMLAKEACSLVLSTQELIDISAEAGVNTAFFIHQYNCATLLGAGEIMTAVEEEALDFEIFQPGIIFDTEAIKQSIKSTHSQQLACQSFKSLGQTGSLDLLSQGSKAQELNDWYAAALKLYPELEQHAKPGWYFSGTCFFKPLGSQT